ncbi:MAG: TonB-dependent receptor [Candidatus Stahlbacteria bacterium]|nr:TonB-dependent receptor [Candidatus Stahlbacteria bacterium]
MKRFAFTFIGVVVFMPLWAGVTGKIAGRVVDKTSGKALQGVNITIEETRFGAATNINGEYYILNITPGTYDVKASMMGYRVMVKKEVMVSIDLTTTINFDLEPMAIQMETFTVKATRPMVIPDATATTKVVETKQIDRQAVHSQTDILTQQAGVVNSGGGASGATGGVHIRGGRADEVAYMVDGMSIKDPISGGAGASISMVAVKEMTITTGGFNAEYGQAMSGLVNLVTREGRKFEGLLRTQTDRASPISEGTNRTEMSIGGPFPLYNKLSYFLSGEVFSRDHFEGWKNTSLKTWQDTTSIFKTAWDSTYHGERGLAKGWSLTGYSNTDREYYSIQGKVGYKPITGVKVDIGGFMNRIQYGSSGQRYCMPRYRLSTINKANQLTLALTHDVKPWLFYTLRVGHFHTHTVTGKRERPATPMDSIYTSDTTITDGDTLISFDTLLINFVDNWDEKHNWWEDFEIKPWWFDIAYGSGELSSPGWQAVDKDSNYYYPYGVPSLFTTRGDARWNERENEYYGAKFDMTSQLGTHHQIKFGIGGNNHLTVKYNSAQYLSGTSPAKKIRIDDSLRWYFPGTFRTVGNDTIYDTVWYRYSDYGPMGDSAWVIYKKELIQGDSVETKRLSNCLYFDEYNEKPKEGYAYIQDKIEYPGFVLNIGLRYDWFDANTWKINNMEMTKRIDTIIVHGDTIFKSIPDTSGTLPKSQISPRFGISFPVTERTVFHLSYGHFFQTPKMSLLYDSYKTLYLNTVGAWPIIGSPNLGTEWTTQYEIGLGHQIGEEMAIHLTAFYKDIYNLIGLRYVKALPNSYSIYMTSDYGNVKGVEVSFEKRAAKWLSGGITYTLSFAEGTSSSEREAYLDYIANTPIDPRTGEPYMLPKTVFALEFDQRHVLNINTNISIPASIMILGNSNLNFVTQIGSGLPWTERDTKGNIVGERNARNLPWNENTDMKFRKDFSIFKQKFYVFAEIANLFNKKNVLDIYDGTGKTDDDGNFQDFDTYIDQTFPSEYNKVGKVPVYPNGGYWTADARRDIDADGYVTKDEWYRSYELAYKDAINGYGAAFSDSRKMTFGIAFTW